MIQRIGSSCRQDGSNEFSSELEQANADCGNWRAAAPKKSCFDQPWIVHRILFSYLIVSIVYTLGIQLHGPFLRTLVECETKPSRWTEFTGSSQCGDRLKVLSVAQAQEGILVGTKLVVHGIVAPFFGSLADRRGRKVVLLYSLQGFSVAFFLLALISATGRASFWILALCFFVEGATNAFDVVYMAMISDYNPTDKARSNAFSLKEVYGAAGEAFAQVASVVILREKLESYTAVWISLLIILIADVFLVRWGMQETLFQTQLPARTAVRDTGITSSFTAPLTIMSNPFLQKWFVAEALSKIGAAGLIGITASFTISAYGWNAGDYQFYTWLCKPVEVASLLCTSYLAQAQTATLAFWGLVLDSIIGICRIASPVSSAFLIVPVYAESVGRSFAVSGTAFFSAQFLQDEQATANALRHLCSNVSTSISHTIFSSSLLYSPSRDGWFKSAPFVFAFIHVSVGSMLKFRLLGPHLEMHKWFSIAHPTQKGQGAEKNPTKS